MLSPSLEKEKNVMKFAFIFLARFSMHTYRPKMCTDEPTLSSHCAIQHIRLETQATEGKSLGLPESG